MEHALLENKSGNLFVILASILMTWQFTNEPNHEISRGVFPKSRDMFAGKGFLFSLPPSMLDSVGMLRHLFLKMLTPLFDMMYFLSKFDNKKTKQLPDWKGLIKNIILNKMKIHYFVHVHLNCLNLMTIHNPFPTHLKHHHYLILKVEIDTLHNKYNVLLIRISKSILLNYVRKKKSLKSLSHL